MCIRDRAYTKVNHVPLSSSHLGIVAEVNELSREISAGRVKPVSYTHLLSVTNTANICKICQRVRPRVSPKGSDPLFLFFYLWGNREVNLGKVENCNE